MSEKEREKKEKEGKRRIIFFFLGAIPINHYAEWSRKKNTPA